MAQPLVVILSKFEPPQAAPPSQGWIRLVSAVFKHPAASPFKAGIKSVDLPASETPMQRLHQFPVKAAY